MNKLSNSTKLNTLWQAVNLAAELRELPRERRTFVFPTYGPITFYLRAEKADVRIARWHLPKVEVNLRLEAAFGWRFAAEQDDAGVYVVAHRRRLLGQLSSAAFSIIVPHDAFLALNLDDGRVSLEGVNGTLEIPPSAPQLLLPAGGTLGGPFPVLSSRVEQA